MEEALDVRECVRVCVCVWTVRTPVIDGIVMAVGHDDVDKRVTPVLSSLTSFPVVFGAKLLAGKGPFAMCALQLQYLLGN